MNLITEYPAIINGIGVFVTAFLTPILAKWGIDSSGTATIVAAILSALSAIAGAVLIAITHKKVTPVADPKLNDGTPLVPQPPVVTITTGTSGVPPKMTPPTE